MKRFAATLALLSCCAASPSPDDNVLRLTGTFACRSLPAAEMHYVGRQAGDTIDVSGDVEPAGGAPFVTDDRYRFDVKNYWEVRTGVGSSEEFDGSGRPWTGNRWEIAGHGPQGPDEHLTMELLEGTDFRRTFAYRDESGSYVPYRVELCERGETPPSPSACISSDFPARILGRGEPDRTKLPADATGSVTVAVSLDATGAVTATRVARSSNARLNAFALDSAQRAKYAPPIHDCKPAAGVRLYDVVVAR